MSSHPNWRIYARDIRTGSNIQELPAATFSFTDELNRAGSFSVTCPLDISGSFDLDPQIGPAKTSVVFERNGQVLWSGVIWGSQINVTANTVTFTGAGWLSYWDRVIWEGPQTTSMSETVFPWSGDGTYPSSTIALFRYTYGAIASLWQALYNETENPARPKNHVFPQVEMRDSGTPDTADRFIGISKLESLGSILREVSAKGQMDFRFRTFRDHFGEIAVSLDSNWPAVGQNNGVVLNGSDNFNIANVNVAGDSIASALFTKRGTGAGEYVTGKAYNEVHADGYVSLATVVPSAPSTADNTTQWNLDQVAHFENFRGRFMRPVLDVSGTLYNDLDPAIGDLTPGEIVEVRAESGYLKLSSDFRITSLTTSVSSSGEEVQQLALVDSVVF